MRTRFGRLFFLTLLLIFRPSTSSASFVPPSAHGHASSCPVRYPRAPAAASSFEAQDICAQPPSGGQWLGALVGATVGDLWLIALTFGRHESSALAVGFGAVGGLAGLGAAVTRPCPKLLPYALSGGVAGSWAALALMSTLEASGKGPWGSDSESLLGWFLLFWAETALPASLGAVWGAGQGAREFASRRSGTSEHRWTLAVTRGRTRVAGWPDRSDGEMWGFSIGRIFPGSRHTVLREEVRYLARGATLNDLAVGLLWSGDVWHGNAHMEFRSVQVALLAELSWPVWRGASVALAAGPVFSGTIQATGRAKERTYFWASDLNVEVPTPDCYTVDEPEPLLAQYSGLEAEARIGLWTKWFFLELIGNNPLYRMAPESWSRTCARRYWSVALSLGVRL